MPASLHGQGEQLILDAAFGGRTIDVGPYNDSTDALSDSATYSSITTEPTVSLNSGTSAVDLGSLSFDVSDSSQSVDALYVRDQSSGDLTFTNTLDSTYDLSSIGTLGLSNGRCWHRRRGV